MKKLPPIPDIPESDQTALVKSLLALLEQFAQRVQLHSEEIDQLKDEINILKGEKIRPVFKGSKLDQLTNLDAIPKKASKQRPGSAKRKKTLELVINEDKVIKPERVIPAGSRFKGYRDFIVQDLIIKTHTIRYRLEHWVTPDNQSLTGELPPSLNNQHFGPHLVSFILYQHHQGQTTQPLLLEQLREWGIDISAGQINRLLLHGKDRFHAEKDAILQAGLKASAYITVDDSGARHQGRNGYVTQMGNDFFAWFQSTGSKSRINFLELLRAGNTDYALTDAALFYMEQQPLPAQSLAQLKLCRGRTLANAADWYALLDSLSITKQRHRRIATEGALLGSVLNHGLCHDLVIVSDDAGQFNILLHALCWIHTERLIHKMLPLNEAHRQEIAGIREQIWCFYADLKCYKRNADNAQQKILKQRFDEIFTQKTSYATLNQSLKRIHNNKAELLMVLDRPEIPLHTNGSETDLRDFIKKRKISGGTRSDEGRRCRDTFASLKKTCRKLRISFWQYLKDRLGIAVAPVAYLPDMIIARMAIATDY